MVEEFKLTRKEKKKAITIIVFIVCMIFTYSICWRSKPQIDCEAEAYLMADYIEEQLENSDQFYKTIPYYKIIVDNVERVKFYYFTYKSLSRLVLENHLEAALVNVTEVKND